MSRPSRVGQRYPIRNEPIASLTREQTPVNENPSPNPSIISERTLRLQRRNLQRELTEALEDNLPTMSTRTEVQRPLTATQQRNLRASAEPDSQGGNPNPGPAPAPEPGGGPSGDPGRTPGPPSPRQPRTGSGDTGDRPSGPPGGDPDPGPPGGDDDGDGDPDDPRDPEDSEEEISNADLAKAILALSKGKGKESASKKTPFKPREPDTFDGSSPSKLRTFVFQCQVYFNARRNEFTKDADRVYFAISYLRDAALDYFEPFINEPDPEESYDFFTDWPAFVQKLTNLFGSYSPEDDDEDAITSISFPNSGKATTYFIEFAKYQNRIKWDDRSLRKVVKDSIPPRITDELRFSREDTSTFEGFKRAVLRIDNDYWKRKQDEANKQRLVQALQSRLSKSTSSGKSGQKSGSAEKNSSSSSNANNASPSDTKSQGKKKKKKNKGESSEGSSSTSAPTSSANPAHIGPDGKLTAVERQR
jgi:hypothetical protein